jgi:hypothetical protein
MSAGPDGGSERAVDAALLAAEQAARAAEKVRCAVEREMEEARYAAGLAERRYEHVDPAKRHVARALEERSNAALERMAALEARIARWSRRSPGGSSHPARVGSSACAAIRIGIGSSTVLFIAAPGAPVDASIFSKAGQIRGRYRASR